MKSHKFLTLIFTFCFTFFWATAGLVFPSDATEINLARGKSYELHPEPTFPNCTDPDDRVQLTDGLTTTEIFWTQQGTVGWQSTPYVAITVDLEKITPIAGADLTTASGPPNMRWPRNIFLQISDDGREFRAAGELVAQETKSEGPLAREYETRCYKIDNLTVRGRYVRFFLLVAGTFAFTDEIRVFRGPDSSLQQNPEGEIVPADPVRFYAWHKKRPLLKKRFDQDLAALKKLLTETKSLPTEKNEKLLDRIKAVEEKISSEMQNNEGTFGDFLSAKEFTTVFPIGKLHAEIFRIQAEIWQNQTPEFRAVAANTWDKDILFGPIPEQKTGNAEPRIHVDALRGEYRAAAFNLYNTGQEPIRVRLRFDGDMAAFPDAGEVTIHDVLWTDTSHSTPVMAALPVIEPEPNGYFVTVQPGLPKQVWLTFCPRKLKPDTYRGNVLIETDAPSSKQLGTVPVSLRVWPIDFPKETSILAGGWSYTNGPGAYSVTAKNRPAFLKHLKERFVNAPWSRPGTLMSFEIEEATRKIILDTSEMDDWLAQWPDAKEYFFFVSINVDTSIKGCPVDSPEFEQTVGRWITSWVEHWHKKGIAPDRINLLIFDEPLETTNIKPFLAWAKAVKKAQPQIKIWEDPVYTKLDQVPQELLESCDVICPNRPQWLRNKSGFDRLYLSWQERGKVLHLYSCSGPAKLLDPYAYYRLQHWHCARIGAAGSFFWAYGDEGGVSSWDEYLASRNLFSSLFIDPQSDQVVAGKHGEAIREGIEDFETIRLLQHLIAQREKEGKSVDEVVKTLDEALRSVLDAPGTDKIYWIPPKDRTIADQARVKILEAILQLQ